jgi:hypothetical protein
VIYEQAIKLIVIDIYFLPSASVQFLDTDPRRKTGFFPFLQPCSIKSIPFLNYSAKI